MPLLSFFYLILRNKHTMGALFLLDLPKIFYLKTVMSSSLRYNLYTHNVPFERV